MTSRNAGAELRAKGRSLKSQMHSFYTIPFVVYQQKPFFFVSQNDKKETKPEKPTSRRQTMHQPTAEALEDKYKVQCWFLK